jgi:hypothetical protein
MPFPSLQTINIGTYANDGTGDDLRTAFNKVNANFTSLYSDLLVNNAANIGTGTGLYAGRNDTNLQFKSLVAGNGVTLTSNSTTVTITAGITKVEDDLTPKLGGSLDLNGRSIINTGVGGDIQSTVYNIDVRQLQTQIDLLRQNLDLGSFNNPYSGNFDMGVF